MNRPNSKQAGCFNAFINLRLQMRRSVMLVSVLFSLFGVASAQMESFESRLRLPGQKISFEVKQEAAKYPVMINPVWTRVNPLQADAGAAPDQLGCSVATSFNAGGAETNLMGSNSTDGSAYNFVRQTGRN